MKDDDTCRRAFELGNNVQQNSHSQHLCCTHILWVTFLWFWRNFMQLSDLDMRYVCTVFKFCCSVFNGLQCWRVWFLRCGLLVGFLRFDFTISVNRNCQVVCFASVRRWIFLRSLCSRIVPKSHPLPSNSNSFYLKDTLYGKERALLRRRLILKSHL